MSCHSKVHCYGALLNYRNTSDGWFSKCCVRTSKKDQGGYWPHLCSSKSWAKVIWLGTRAIFGPTENLYLDSNLYKLQFSNIIMLKEKKVDILYISNEEKNMPSSSWSTSLPISLSEKLKLFDQLTKLFMKKRAEISPFKTVELCIHNISRMVFLFINYWKHMM